MGCEPVAPEIYADASSVQIAILVIQIAPGVYIYKPAMRNYVLYRLAATATYQSSSNNYPGRFMPSEAFKCESAVSRLTGLASIGESP
jgi:hypothetical protein